MKYRIDPTSKVCGMS